MTSFMLQEKKAVVQKNLTAFKEIKTLPKFTISKRGLNAMLFGASGAAGTWIMKLPMCINDYFWYLTLAELETESF